jgi:hypothetical protein
MKRGAPFVFHFGIMIVWATIEVVLDCADGDRDRNFNEEAGLN